MLLEWLAERACWRVKSCTYAMLGSSSSVKAAAVLLRYLVDRASPQLLSTKNTWKEYNKEWSSLSDEILENENLNSRRTCRIIQPANSSSTSSSKQPAGGTSSSGI